MRTATWWKIGAALMVGLMAGPVVGTAGAEDGVLAGRHITVSGEGTVRARPDLAVADLGVTAYGETATLAMAENRRRVGALLLALRENDVDEADVITSDFGIFRESHRRRGDEGVEERFVVRNLLQVTIRDIDRAGVLIDRLVEAGANEVRGIRFARQDDTELALQARELAAEAARDKAEHLARLHGARLGPVLRISESGVRPVRADAVMMNAMKSESSTVSAGELTFAAHLQVIYALTD